MGIGSGTAALIGGLASAGGSIASGAMGASAAGNAASEQAQAAEQAAQLQYQASQNALNFQEQQWNQEQQNEAPWLQSGTGALSNLDYLMGITPQTSAQFTGNNGGSNTISPITGTLSPINPGGYQTVGGMPPQQAYYNANQGTAPTGTVQSNGGTAVQPSSNSGFSNANRNGGAFGTSSAAPASGARPALEGSGLSLAGSTPTSGSSTALSGYSPTSGGYGSLMQPWNQTFTAPTDITEQNDPGYQARLKLGTDAIQRSAAAAGGVVTGGTAQALDQFGQDYASNEYNNVYNRALSTYGTNYNTFENNQANQFNRLAALSGVGQTAASQLATAGQAASNNVSSNLLNTANNMGQAYQNAAAANASGLIGSSNAWSGAINGATNNLSQLALLQQLYGGGNSTGSIYDDLTMGY